VKALLHYIYKDALIEDAESSSSSGSSVGPSASDTLAAKLLGAADKYKLPRLSLMCESVLCKDISVDSVANILALADRYNASALKSVCLKFAAENLIAVMRSDGFDYLREHCPSLQSELLKTVAGCEEELSGGGGKTRSVWGQFSDGGAETNGRQAQTWGDINGGAERSQSVWVEVVNANGSGRNNNDNNNSDDPMAELED
jgi:speckle-type POZ protein